MKRWIQQSAPHSKKKKEIAVTLFIVGALRLVKSELTNIAHKELFVVGQVGKWTSIKDSK